MPERAKTPSDEPRVRALRGGKGVPERPRPGFDRLAQACVHGPAVLGVVELGMDVAEACTGHDRWRANEAASSSGRWVTTDGPSSKLASSSANDSCSTTSGVASSEGTRRQACVRWAAVHGLTSTT